MKIKTATVSHHLPKEANKEFSAEEYAVNTYLASFHTNFIQICSKNPRGHALPK